MSASGEGRQTGQLAITQQERCPWERGVSGHSVPDADRRPPNTFRGNLGGGVTGVSLGSGGSVGSKRPRGPGSGAFQSAEMTSPSPQGEMGNFRKVLSDTTC